MGVAGMCEKHNKTGKEEVDMRPKGKTSSRTFPAAIYDKVGMRTRRSTQRHIFTATGKPGRDIQIQKSHKGENAKNK